MSVAATTRLSEEVKRNGAKLFVGFHVFISEVHLPRIIDYLPERLYCVTTDENAQIHFSIVQQFSKLLSHRRSECSLQFSYFLSLKHMFALENYTNKRIDTTASLVLLIDTTLFVRYFLFTAHLSILINLVT